MTIQTIAHALLTMSQQESFLFFASIAATVYSVPRFFRRLKHKQNAGTATQQHNIAFVLAIAGWIALCVNFPFNLVLREDTFDWMSACVVLVGTCWVAIGAVMTKKEESDMLALLTPTAGAAQPTAIETLTVKALVNASAYCRSGLVVIALGTLIQMAHLVDRAHPNLFAMSQHVQTQAQAGSAE